MKRAILFAVLAVFAFFGVEIYRAGLHESAPPPTTTQVVFNKGSASGRRIGTRSWSADYDHVLSNGDQTVLDLDGVKNGIIYKDGKPYLHMRAEHMSVNTISHDFSATGPLHIETVSHRPPRSFDTTSAVWYDAAKRLTLTQRITIHSGAEAPLSVGSLTFDVKGGQLEMHDVAGAVNFK